VKLFVWADHHSFQVTAHAETVEKARILALKEIGGSDESTPVRNRVIQFVRDYQPTIWIGENADYAIEEKYGAFFS
jgi:hypothetical protein